MRRQGEALHPDREPLEVLDRIRRTIGEYNFAGQYQQSPASVGRLVKAEWFKRYRENDRPMPHCTRTNWHPSYSDTRSSHGGLLECGIVLRKPLIALEHVLPIHDRSWP